MTTPMLVTTADQLARLLLQDMGALHGATAKLLREFEALRTRSDQMHGELVATRRELAEVRARVSHSPKEGGVGKTVTRIVQNVAYNAPDRIQRFESNDPNTVTVRMGGKVSSLGADRVEHVVQARLPGGRFIRLPDGVSYDKAVQFVSMPALDRRKHWHGDRTIYTLMLQLIISSDVELGQRSGRAYAWRKDSPLDVRLRWVRQFAPPHRVGRK